MPAPGGPRIPRMPNPHLNFEMAPAIRMRISLYGFPAIAPLAGQSRYARSAARSSHEGGARSLRLNFERMQSRLPGLARKSACLPDAPLVAGRVYSSRSAASCTAHSLQGRAASSSASAMPGWKTAARVSPSANGRLRRDPRMQRDANAPLADRVQTLRRVPSKAAAWAPHRKAAAHLRWTPRRGVARSSAARSRPLLVIGSSRPSKESSACADSPRNLTAPVRMLRAIAWRK